MEVCNSMESEREIKVEGLTDEEAWSLFKDKVGIENVIMSTEIQPIARQVAKECGRLPLALITVGCALRKADRPQVWRNALQLLRTSRANQLPSMGKEVLGSLKFSYDSLSSDTTRSCFLYCALYPEDDEIFVDELIEHWMGEGLINEKGSIQTDIDKGHAYLKELKDACMIESTSTRNDGKYVKMHDLVRDLAINLTNENQEQPLFMVKAGLCLTESPEEEEWVESLQRVSLMRNNIKAFRGQANCPRLSTLLLHNKFLKMGPEITFSDTFFKHMHNLRVLNLSNTAIKSLPDSISDLVNLQALILTGSQLTCLPSLAKLQKLRQLNFGRLTFLEELPHGLENLVKLRHLDISNGAWGGSPYGALVKMSSLEILYMHNKNWRFLPPGHSGHVVDNSKIGEVISLKNLTRFWADFDDVLTFNRYICRADEFGLLKNFDYFLFTVDLHNVENESMEKVTLPSIANYLEIDACNFIQLLDIFGSNDLRPLIDCSIKNCDEMLWIGGDGEIVLPSLKSLALCNLQSFKGLCKEKAYAETFKSLTHLWVQCCSKLKYLIPIDLLVNNLQNLEEILIHDCSEMEEIISGEASADMITLPKLKTLCLQHLPRLTSICQGKLVCDLFQVIQLKHCPKLERLPFLISNESNIEVKISMSQGWWENLAWEDPQLKGRLQPLFVRNDDKWLRAFSCTERSQKFQIAKLNFQDNNDWILRRRSYLNLF